MNRSTPVFITAILACASVAARADEASYYPLPESKGGWRKLDGRADVRRIGGMDPDRLADLKQWLLDSDERNFAAVVIRHGHIVLEVERGNSAKTDARRVASVSKAICATVLGIAAERSRQGRTPRRMKFDDPAFDFIPWARPLSDPRKAAITVRQLLNHTSGITPEATSARNRGPWKHVLGHDGDPHTEKLSFDPGKGCGYSTFAFYHAALVCENVTGKPYDQFVIEALFEPIGVEHWWFQTFEGGDDRYGSHPSHAAGTPARDLARIAYCMLHQGRWNDRQVIPRWFVDETAQPTHSVEGPELRFGVDAGAFSHGWELPARLTGERGPSGRGIPDDARYKPGSGGQLIAFVPSLDLVVTRQTGGSGPWEYTEYLRRACAAIATDPPNDESTKTKDAKADGPASYPKWSTIEITLRGPDSQGRGEPNPFDVALDAVFTAPSGARFRVPGFYAGDGRGGLDGNVWKVRFSADEVGDWTYATVASDDRLNARAGRFRVTPPAPDGLGFRKWGRLECVGDAQNGIRYPKFRDGPYWLKAGCDDPENFLGAYENFDTLVEREKAVDYLATRGIDSLYIMTHNIDGDDNDVWPWLGASPGEAKANGVGQVRFDIAKLDRWRRLFEHMQTKGVVPYLVLEDDSAWKDYDHRRYYREMVARFGDLPALVFNLGEESNENYTLAESLEFARLLAQIDPYGHPRAIHNVNAPSDAYIDSPHVDMTAIQTGQPGKRTGLANAIEHNRLAIDWIEQCRSRKQRVLVVGFDEGRPEHDRRAWWSAYLGGAVWEAHVVGPYDRPLSTWDETWTQLGGTGAFMKSLPFQDMAPRNDLVERGAAFCLAKPGHAYALYLPQGGSASVRLSGNAQYVAEWWNPSNGLDGKYQGAHRVSGETQAFTAPASGDWALRILRADGGAASDR